MPSLWMSRRRQPFAKRELARPKPCLTERLNSSTSLRRVVADGGYGSADIVGWLVDERGIEPHVNQIDKSERRDGTFSRSDFAFDTERDLYVCPAGKELRKSRRAFSTPREGVAKDGAIRYRAVRHDCDACMLKPKCCPNMPARKIAIDY